jgi:two-component system KDP operon response regulator KdpE
MENKTLILVADDEESISNFISAVLTSNDFSVIKAASGRETISMAASRCPDLMLLDLGLPDMDGLEVLKSVRCWTRMPIIVVSARGREREKVEALDMGADDYITKPFGTAELLARIRTALRHNGASSDGTPLGKEILKTGGLEINCDKRTVLQDGTVIHLTPIEYKILLLLARNLGKVLTHDSMIKEIWGPYTSDAGEIQALRVNMANIRRKIEKNPAEPRYIVTEVGVGYRMLES